MISWLISTLLLIGSRAGGYVNRFRAPSQLGMKVAVIGKAELAVFA